MIVFNRKPVVIQEWPIIGWNGFFPKRSKERSLKVDLDFDFYGEDASKVDELVHMIEKLMTGATFKGTGEPVIPTKIAKLQTADGRTAPVSASSIPEGMLVGKEQEDGKGERPKRVQQGEGEGVQEKVRPGVWVQGIINAIRLTLSPYRLSSGGRRDPDPKGE
jgi:hypothetical protein